MPWKDIEKRREYERNYKREVWHPANRARVNEARCVARPARSSEVVQRTQDYMREYQRNNREKFRGYSRKRRSLKGDVVRAGARAYILRRKLEVLAKYGGACKCCGENCHAFLSLDHVHNDGAQERKTITQQALYRKLRREPVNSRYQILCFNCNIAKGVLGSCPHQTALAQILGGK